MTANALRLMTILAHPDDESLGLGGVIAKYASEGIEVAVVTATLGERGRYLGERDGPNHPGMQGLGALRAAELRAATSVLGVKHLELLGYHDGDLDRVDPREAIARIAAHVRRLRPHVVITFAPDGAYGHPDHIAICQFATAATIAAADPTHGAASAPPHAVAKLYYMVSNEASWAAYQSAFKKMTSVVDGIEREVLPWPEWEITTRIDTRAHWETVWKAVSCHYSQVASYEKLKNLPPDQHEALWGSQHFYRAFSTVNGGRVRETDLFEGLRG
jgi:LmbE family N-acetylglucosaminyl deacetylase